jgi:hypothetical protein
MVDSRQSKPRGTIVTVVMPILAAVLATLLTHYLLGQFQAIRARTNITADLGSLLTSLQPNLQVEITKERLSAGGSLDVSLLLTNKGTSTITVSGASLDVSFSPINADQRQGKFLVVGKDYEGLGNTATAGYTPPGAVLKHAINIRIKAPISEKMVYYVVTYKAESVPAVRAIMRQSLGKTVGAFGQDLDSLAKATFFIASAVQSR